LYRLEDFSFFFLSFLLFKFFFRTEFFFLLLGENFPGFTRLCCLLLDLLKASALVSSPQIDKVLPVGPSAEPWPIYFSAKIKGQDMTY
jgi:hypothetical protein